MEAINEEEKNEMREILSVFYGKQAFGWGITKQSYELFGELISKTRQCDAAMNWVPRPFYVGSALNWAKKQVRQEIIRHFKKSKNKHYLICMREAALAMKTEFFRAQY